MKLLVPLLVSSLASAQLVYPQQLLSKLQPYLTMPVIPQTPFFNNEKPSGSPLLADVLPLDRSISIFSGFTRSVDSLATRLNDRSTNTTVLAPTNSAISALPRKPWEDRGDEMSTAQEIADKFAGIAGEDRASRNLRRFVQAHALGDSPWERGEKRKTLEGVEIWWEEDAGKKGERKIMPDGITVREVKSEVDNGELWILEGVINYGAEEDSKDGGKQEGKDGLK